MKGTTVPTSRTKQKILEESRQQKLQTAKALHSQGKIQEAIQMYHKVLFLEETSECLSALAQIYEKDLLDVSSAILFYRRAHFLRPKNTYQVKQKLKQLTKIKGLQLLEMGGCKNILEGLGENIDANSQEDQILVQFKKIYPTFHRRIVETYILGQNEDQLKSNQGIEPSPLKNYLQTSLAFLEVNHREFAYGQIENCVLIDEKNVDILVLKALMNWSMLEKLKGYQEFWEAYKVNPEHSEVALFLRLILPRVQELYKEAKYDLIQGNTDKCRLKVLKGLEIHPYHTNLLILKAYLHRVNEEFEIALTDLQLATKTLQNRQLESELRSQTSLTYNQMGIFLFKQGKFNEAITLFTEGLSFKPDDYGLYTNRGDCQKALNQYIKALEDYLRAYEIEKKNGELNFRISSIYSIRGVSLFNSKNYDLALKEFEESLKYCPKHEQFILSKAKCLIQLDRKSESVQMLNETLKQNPYMNELRQMLQQIQDPDEQKEPKTRKRIQISKQKS